ncbi:helix-turn-helix transcriptional regulator [Microbacterium sp. P04]|uniref:helix-turn-helix transcriptional regulator n=1 Tax=Microbacterium sp. P04 TaxID=3366947 RepID=UPI00374688C4
MGSDLRAFGEYLRARRNVTQPEDVGLRRDAGRRVPGLRRDETAMLAGMSNEYYLRLEQGRGGRPSDQVMLSLARVFGLDEEARIYMFRMVTGAVVDPAPPAHSAEQIGRVLDQWQNTPAYLSDRHRDIVASNVLATHFGNGGLAAGSNVVIDMFAPHMRRDVLNWEEMTLAALASLRRDAPPNSPRLAQIVDLLSAEPDFPRMWSRHDVSGPGDATFHLRVPGVGTIDVEAQNFGVHSLPGYQITVLAARPGSTAAHVFAHLAASLAERQVESAPPAVPTSSSPPGGY